MKNNKKNGIFYNFREILKFIDVIDIKRIIIWSCLMLFIYIIPTFSVFLNKILIDQFTYINKNKSNQIMITCIFICVLIHVLEIFVDYLTNKCSILYNEVNSRATHKLEVRFYSIISSLPLEYFEDYKLHKEIELAQYGITMNGIEVMNSVITVISGIISMISVFLMLWLVSWYLPIAIIISTLPSLAAVILTKIKRYTKHEKFIEERRKRDYLASLFLTRKTVKELKVFSAFNYLIDCWKKMDIELRKEDIKTMLYENKINLCALSISKIFAAVVMIWLVYLIKSSHITIGSFVSLVSATSLLSGSLETVFSAIANLYENNKYLTALFKVFNMKSYQNCDTEKNKFEYIGDFKSIKFCNVSFLYPSASVNAITNVNFEIKKGESVAILGHNGSGKTTLLNLMMGLYQNYQGEILINGHELKKGNYEKYQSQIACVFQNYNQYDMSLRENIGIGNIKEIENDELIQKVLKKVDLDKLTNYSLDTILSPFYNGGIDLSGGEWQKIALARALFRQSELYFFDEPTAALDPESEIRFYKNTLKVIKDKTFIIVSHRLAVTRFCDKIIVLRNGNIAEIGTHQELINRHGVYWKMYCKQTGIYDKTYY